jgi:hypothetical protein
MNRPTKYRTNGMTERASYVVMILEALKTALNAVTDSRLYEECDSLSPAAKRLFLWQKEVKQWDVLCCRTTTQVFSVQTLARDGLSTLRRSSVLR